MKFHSVVALCIVFRHQMSDNHPVIAPDALDEGPVPLVIQKYARQVIQVLSQLPRPNNPGKTVLAKYHTKTLWGSMDEKQRAAIIAAWEGLAKEKKDEITEQIQSSAVAIINSTIVENGSTTPGQQIVQATNKHDKVRLMHIFVDPSFAMTWSSAHRPKERPALDDHDNTIDYWGILADAMNDYDKCKYINCTATVEGVTGTMKRKPGMETAFTICNEINPSLGLHVRPMRDAAWIKSVLRDFKKDWAVIYSNYTKSGEQDGCDRQEEFARFYQGKEVIMYAFALFGEQDIERHNNMLGKTIPDGAWSDSGILNNGAAVVPEAGSESRTSKAQAKARNRAASSSNTASNSNAEPAIQRKIIEVNVSGLPSAPTPTPTNAAGNAEGAGAGAGSASAGDCMVEFQMNLAIIQQRDIIDGEEIVKTAQETLKELQQEMKRRRTGNV